MKNYKKKNRYISLREPDSEFDWDFDAGNDDSEFSIEIMEVE
jgi:hypothetical protein